MNVQRVIPSGYCKGVINAINIAKKAKDKNPNTDVFVLGNLVHNSFVTKQLNDYGIITLDDTNKTRSELLDEINSGTLILTAHGTSDEVIAKAKAKGLEVIDGTCEDVLKTKNIIINYLDKGYDVIYYGKRNHPEANAIVSMSDKIHLICNEEDITNLTIKNKQIVFTNQTTMSFIELERIVDLLKEKYQTIEIIKEICNATSLRQQAILNLDDCDVLYIVGDSKSNNTNRLVSIAKNNNIKKVYMINDYRDINKKDLIGQNNIYVSAGASTPPTLIDEAINYLKNITF